VPKTQETEIGLGANSGMKGFGSLCRVPSIDTGNLNKPTYELSFPDMPEPEINRNNPSLTSIGKSISTAGQGPQFFKTKQLTDEIGTMIKQCQESLPYNPGSTQKATNLCAYHEIQSNVQLPPDEKKRMLE